MPQQNQSPKTSEDSSLFNNSTIANITQTNGSKISRSTIILVILAVFVFCIFAIILGLALSKQSTLNSNTQTNSNTTQSNNLATSNFTTSSESVISNSQSSSVESTTSSENSSQSQVSSSAASIVSNQIEYAENNGKFIYFKYPKGWNISVWPNNGIASYNKEVLDNVTNTTKNISCNFSGIRKVIAKSSTMGYEIGSTHPFVTSGKSDNNCICDNDCGGFGCEGEEYSYEVSIDQNNNLVKVVAKHNDAYTNSGSDFTKDFKTKSIFSKYFPESNSYAYYVNFNTGGHFITFADKDRKVNINSFYPQNQGVCAYYSYNDIVNLDKLVQNTTSTSVLTDSIGGNVTYIPSTYYNAQNNQNLFFTLSQKTMQNVKLTCETASSQEEFEKCIEPVQIYLQSAKRYK